MVNLKKKQEENKQIWSDSKQGFDVIKGYLMKFLFFVVFFIVFLFVQHYWGMAINEDKSGCSCLCALVCIISCLVLADKSNKKK